MHKKTPPPRNDMMAATRRMRKSVLAGVLGLLGAFAGTGQALATLAEGCDPRVFQAMKTTAQARVANTKAVIDTLYTQDDSVLALMCFNQLAATATEHLGQVYSGDFRPTMQAVVEDALMAMYRNFDASIGKSSGVVDYSAAATRFPDEGAAYRCRHMDALWVEFNRRGMNTEIPLASLDDMRADPQTILATPFITPDSGFTAPVPTESPSAAPSYIANWNAPATLAARNQMESAKHDLPVPEIEDFSALGDNPTTCQILQAANLYPPDTCP